jgi:hypothetical protein
MRTIILLSLICALNPINQLFSQEASLIYKNTVNSTVKILVLMDRFMSKWRKFRDECNNLTLANNDWGY